MRPYLLFATDRLHVPDDHSGSVQTTHAIVTSLLEQGFDCHVLATLREGPRFLLASIAYRASFRTITPEWVDGRAGYPVIRGSQWRFSERVQKACTRRRPDFLVLDSFRQLRTLYAAGFVPSCPIILFVHDIRFLDGPKTLPWRNGITYVANSPFTAAMLQQHFDITPSVIPPLIDFARYRTEKSGRECVTMVSPTTRKGLSTTLAAARALPDQPFLLVEGWPMNKDEWLSLEGEVSSYPNVALRRSTPDMRTVYADTRVLLMPSFVEETFGRVVVEAQFNGIPVIARDRGALRWVVGNGGIVLPEDADDSSWIAALDSLLGSRETYERLSAASAENAQRADFRVSGVVEALVQLFESALSSGQRLQR